MGHNKTSYSFLWNGTTFSPKEQRCSTWLSLTQTFRTHHTWKHHHQQRLRQQYELAVCNSWHMRHHGPVYAAGGLHGRHAGAAGCAAVW